MSDVPTREELLEEIKEKNLKIDELENKIEDLSNEIGDLENELFENNPISVFEEVASLLRVHRVEDALYLLERDNNELHLLGFVDVVRDHYTHQGRR